MMKKKGVGVLAAIILSILVILGCFISFEASVVFVNQGLNPEKVSVGDTLDLPIERELLDSPQHRAPLLLTMPAGSKVEILEIQQQGPKRFLWFSWEVERWGRVAFRPKKGVEITGWMNLTYLLLNFP